MRSVKKATIALEDGSFFTGFSFGADGEAVGEIVFNTSMAGYQEILTDPSYCGQIVTMTYPLIGNYGVNGDDNESVKPFLSGFVVREAANVYSNWRAEGSLEEFLKCHRIVGVEGIDTRALTRKIREQGAMKAIVSTSGAAVNDLVKKAKDSPGLIGRDLVKEVTTTRSYQTYNGASKYRVVAFDFGIKKNILNLLAAHNFKTTVVPAATSAAKVLAQNPDGVFLSNGPGDPAAVNYAVEAIKHLLGKVPLFGICLGHQLLALALGAKTYKLKFGHHGANHPVKNLLTGKVEITAQNHGFAVDPKTLPKMTEITHLNLNDQTVEGLRCSNIPAFSVQYHPEASPGPHDSRYLFADFVKLIEDFKRSQVAGDSANF